MASIWKRNGNWRAEVRRRGYPLRTSTFDTKAMAEAWARRVESEMDRVDRETYVARTEAGRKTLGDLLIRYSKEISPGKKSGVGEIQRIKVLCTDPIAQLKAASLSGKAMAEFRDRRLNGSDMRKKVSGSTVNRELTLIGHVINVARKEWGVHMNENPVSIIRRPKENRGRTRRLGHEEEARLLAELEASSRHDRGYFLKGGTRNECARPIVILAIETAMRRSEILSLRWEDVHLADCFARLHDTKNGEARDVPLSKRAVQTLLEWSKGVSKPQDKVFPTSPDALKKAFTRACLRAKLENLHFHDLRHEATSRIAEKLDNILELSAVTGHKTVQMLRRYYHPRAKDLALKLG